jgi:hypothetical protein
MNAMEGKKEYGANVEVTAIAEISNGSVNVNLYL